ncbi:MAG: CbbQ/NirQ/NorQ/GpvN family protein [Nitrospirae bacterium]|nr:CbbQ/NirQ/NorQ/GpvN family protein [Nitrospirota bacterium]
MSSRPFAPEADIAQYLVQQAPYYVPVHQEVELFETAYANQLPVMLKGPTGCGKSRFVQYMAHRLKRPLITVACHEDVTASDLVGRYLLHPLTDARRILPIEKKAELLEAGKEFMLVISYNPGYQSVVKELKQSTKQRFIAVDFDYPPPDVEARIIQHESGVSAETAAALVKIGEKVRHLKQHGLEEGVSTRLLVYAGALIQRGIPPHSACEAAIARPLTDDLEIQRSIRELVSAVL